MGAAGSDMASFEMDVDQFQAFFTHGTFLNYEEEDFQKLANEDGKISKEKMKELTLQTDCFLTHDWGEDELGRSNHERVATINAALKEQELATWFDSERMEGNILAQMCAGIEHSGVVVVFVTQRYLEKVGGDITQDNCLREFTYAERRKTAAKMIPVVMEPRVRNTSEWTGPVGMVLGGDLYIDLSEDDKLHEGITQLVNTIRNKLGK